MANMTESPAPKNQGRWPIWPLSITIFLVFFVLSLLGFWIYASRQDGQLVTKNYYARELIYQDQIDRKSRANTLAEPVVMTFHPTEKRFEVVFPVAFDPVNVTGTLTFYRPNDASADVQHLLQLEAQRRQNFDINTLARGFWRVNLLWKVDGLEYFNESSFVLQ